MTKLEAWLEEKKKHFDDFGSLSEYDAKAAILVIEQLKAALEKVEDTRKIGHKEPDSYTMLGCLSHIATTALSIDPENPGGPDEFKNKSQAV